jgi:hypothetical protein
MANTLSGMLTADLLNPIQQAPLTGQQAAMQRMQDSGTRLRKGMSGMFGSDLRTTTETVQDELTALMSSPGFNDQDPESQRKLITLVAQVNKPKAAQMAAQFAENNRKLAAQRETAKEEKTKAEAAAQKADIVNVGGGSLYKVSTGEFLTAPGVAEAKADKDAPKPLPEPAQRSLLAQADRLGVTPEDRVNLVTALSTGLVTDIKGIDSFVQAPVEPNYTKEVSVAIADANKAFTQGSQGARQAESIITNILSSDALQSAGGLRANISEGFKEIIGGRDLLSTLRTQSTAVINTEVVNN